jgi:hypothetical protein
MVMVGVGVGDGAASSGGAVRRDRNFAVFAVNRCRFAEEECLVKVSSILLLLLIVLSPVLAQADPFTPKGGKFTITFPPGMAEPQDDPQTTSGPDGPLTSHAFQIWKRSDMYAVAYFDYPEKSVQKQDANATLKENRERIRVGMQATIQMETFSKWQGRPALSFRWTTGMGGVPTCGRALYVLDKRRLYTIMFSTTRPPAELDSADISKLFSSFKIL